MSIAPVPLSVIMSALATPVMHHLPSTHGYPQNYQHPPSQPTPAPPPPPPSVPYRFVKEQYVEENGQRFVVQETHRLHLVRDTYHPRYVIDNPTAPAQCEWEVVDGRRYLVRESWYERGRLHRVDGPAFRRWTLVRLPEGVVMRQLTWEAWYQCGTLHRVGGAARRAWRSTERDVPAGVLPPFYYLAWEEWLQDGAHYRVGGPALQHWAFVGAELTLQEEQYHPPLVRVASSADTADENEESDGADTEDEEMARPPS